MSEEAGGAPADRLLALVSAGWAGRAVATAARMEIPEILADGPRTAAEVAHAARADAAAIGRLLRALTALDVCRATGGGRFGLTPTGALLRKDAPGSLRPWTLAWVDRSGPLWDRLEDVVRTGTSARTLLAGTAGFDHLDRDPDAAAEFHAAMAGITRALAPAVLEAHDFTAARVVVDVGGGSGALLEAILDAAPAARGVLYDLPHAVTEGKRRLEAAGLAPRCAFVAGSFFDWVPGGDVLVLKSVLHDWRDDAARVILARCRAALPPGGRIVLVERVVPGRLTGSAEHRDVARSDLHMLVALGAGERTEEEWRALLAAAGLAPIRFAKVAATFHVIECAAADGPAA